MCRLQRGAPAFPLLRFGRGGGGQHIDIRAILYVPADQPPTGLVAFPAYCCGIRADHLTLRTRRPVDGLADVQRLRKPRSVHPVQRIADLKPNVLSSADEPVIGARPAKRNYEPARLEHPECLTQPAGVPRLLCVAVVHRVPALAHELEPVGRITDDAVNGRRSHIVHVVNAIRVHHSRRMARAIHLFLRVLWVRTMGRGAGTRRHARGR